MKLALAFLSAALPGLLPLSAAELKLTSPLEYQVIQRSSREVGVVRIAGTLSGVPLEKVVIEAQVEVVATATPSQEDKWQKLSPRFNGDAFQAEMGGPAGGWHALEVRASIGGKIVAEASVEHLGIGEVFVVAGQSNAANHGEEKQVTETERVSAFDGTRWQLANDPQPGASGSGGSFMPAFGDALVKELDVPVGIIACGIGATSVREWLPKGATFPTPPTRLTRVTQLPNGEWASNGVAFAALVARMKPFGERGFRAVLWHQGESDAKQQEAGRTLSGALYRQYLTRVIRDSRLAIGWDAPWFVAQASYHGPEDDGSPDIRAAQAALWRDGVALEGPDSDALKGELRERNGKGVHFSGPGLREHGAQWAEKILPWLTQQLATNP